MKNVLNRLRFFPNKYIDQKGQNIAHPYRFIEQPDDLRYFDGIFSIKKAEPLYGTSPGTEYVFTEGRSILPGIVTGKNFRELNLINGKPKVFTQLSPSIYHFVAEDMMDVICNFYYNDKYKDMQLVIDVSQIWEILHKGKNYDIFWFFLQSLKDKKIDHKVINLGKFDVLHLDSFFLLENLLNSSLDKFSKIHKYLLDYVKEPDVEPYKKVYVSRSKYQVPQPKEIIGPDGKVAEIAPSRIDDESVIEKIFVDLGFEIVYPEDFESFNEQLNFFYSVKTMASITSAGMVNQIYMQPGGNVIEIITPLIAQPIGGDGTKGYVNAEFHNYYKNMAASFGHFYFGLPNVNALASEFQDMMSSNPSISGILRGL